MGEDEASSLRVEMRLVLSYFTVTRVAMLPRLLLGDAGQALEHGMERGERR